MMKRWTVICLPVLLSLSASLADGPKQDNSAIVGLWRGEMGGLPAVVLNITDEGGELQGAMLFYLMRPGEKTSSPGVPEPLFHPEFDGKSLTFLLSHRHAHADTTSDPPVKFRLGLVGPDEADLVRIPQDGPAKFRLVRDKNWK